MAAISCLFWSFVVLLLAGLLTLMLLGIREILLGTGSRDWRRGIRGAALVAPVLAVAVFCGALLNSIRECLAAPYSSPPATFQSAALTGTWQVHYMDWGVDRLIIRADGTFKQVYRDRTLDGYVYETPWNAWSLERLADGRVRIHLQGARYYLEGIRIAEENGMHPAWLDSECDDPWCAEAWPRGFFDPVGHDEVVHMVEELVLNVRSDSSGQLHLLHMRIGGGLGFGLVCQWEEFRRVATP